MKRIDVEIQDEHHNRIGYYGTNMEISSKPRYIRVATEDGRYVTLTLWEEKEYAISR